MAVDIESYIYDIQARQRLIEERMDKSDAHLAVSIDKLSAVVDRLNSKLDTFVELHQRFVMHILIIVAGIFLGKEVVVGLMQYFLKTGG